LIDPPHASLNSPVLRVTVIGGGPAGLMAAEVLAAGGARVDVFDAMPSVGRKLLLAGRGGLNLTHSEPLPAFLSRYEQAQNALTPYIDAFGPQALRDWAQDLGIATFVGTSGRVFPSDLKAAPLLRAWLQRLRGAGITFHTRTRWQGWGPDGSLCFAGPGGDSFHPTDATVLALGGASWPKLGSDGAWVRLLESRGVAIAALKPANCGFDVASALSAGWSEFLSHRFAGLPVKPVAASFTDSAGRVRRQQGEFVVTATGVEGSLIYAFAAELRDTIERDAAATLSLDLLPAHSPQQVQAAITRDRGSRSLAKQLKGQLGIEGVKLALLHEVLGAERIRDPLQLAAAIKSLPITLIAPRPIAEAISSAGGVRFDALDPRLMLREIPGVFCAGEMLDWEAPTGGYLLTAAFASGRAAGSGVLDWWRTMRAGAAA
jgi:uncharacterized flavoprotein (TIGR03862 family)